MSTSVIILTLFSLLTPIKTKSIQDHFPRIPEIPGGEFIAVTTEIDSREAALLASDIVGRPLGADPYDLIGEEDDDEAVDVGLDGDKFEGDIAGVFVTSLANLEGNDHEVDSLVRNAVSRTYQRWPFGRVPYSLSRKFGKRDRRTIRRAMEQIQDGSVGCIRFEPRKWPEDADYMHILVDDGCYSRVGRMGKGSGQILSLGPGCVRTGIVVHELLHALGFWHEQSRPDRDEHVSVQWQNIEYGREDNFARYSRGEVSTLELDYDKESIMHYEANAFSRNGLPTIVSLRGTANLGQRNQMTKLDIQKLRRLYGCEATIPSKATATMEVLDPDCVDVMNSKFCNWWTEQGACQNFQSYMQETCPRTCGLCPLIKIPEDNENSCRDVDARCQSWVSQNSRQCSEKDEFMSEACAKTCGYCYEPSVGGASSLRVTRFFLILFFLMYYVT